MANELKDKFIGQRFGDYELVRVLATGGMARIYVGRDVNLGREVAIKVLTPEMIASDSLLAERFIREARSVAVLEHPNIIPIYQYQPTPDGAYFLAMKLVRGGDLADEISVLQKQGQTMPIDRMLKILRQTAAALDYAHQHGIIHRDVKPSNILIDRVDDKAILTDFGLVLSQSETDKTMGTAFGTPRYISPEQALASESVVPQSDIYSLAVIVYEMLTGTPVFKADTAMQVALSHISEPPPPPSQINSKIPKAVEVEILKALEKDADLRHATATQFIEALADAYGKPMQLGMMPKQTGKLVSDETEQDTEVKPQVPPKQPVNPIPSVNPALPAKPSSDKQGGKLGLFLVVGLLLVGGVLGVLALSGGGNDEQPEPTAVAVATDETPSLPSEPDITSASQRPIISFAPSTFSLGAEQDVTLVYNRYVLAIHNPYDFNLAFSDIQIVRDDRIYIDANSSIMGPSIPPNRCLLFQTAEERVTVPSEWNCGNIRQQIASYSDGLFWVGDGGSFTIKLPDGAVECPRTTSESQVTCTIRLRQIES